MSHGAFYDTIAPRYDELLTVVPRERWIRRGFQGLVERFVRPGSLLLDVGCGTGLDAAWYAARGYRVLAYDISAGMVDQLRQRCASEIAQEKVVPFTAPFAGFAEAVAGRPRPDAVVANYGVVNAMPEPREFFDAMAPLVAPGSPLIVSVLNPFYWRDMTHRWWWSALRRSGRTRGIVTSGEGVATYRHFVSSLVAAARPAFRLRERASLGALVPRAGTPLDWESPRSLAERVESRLWKTFPVRDLGLWVFLVFERT
jgi:SAM-dependent methyltransferase